ncbi:MAG: hypothetical protein SGPRY_001632 [Prymnesium sp.]
MGFAVGRCPFSLRFTLTARAVTSEQAADGTSLQREVWLRGMQCRRPHESVVCTYTDVDGAISPAAVLPPLRATETCDAAAGCPVLLTLHGTSIPVRDSADAYKRKVKPSDAEYTFGVEG